MTQIHKEYVKSFLLEPTKLTRIVDQIHGRLADQKGAKVQDHFHVFLSNNRQEELSSLDQVLALENSKRYKIERLLVTSSSVMDGAVHHQVELDFAGPKSNTDRTKVVALRVRSDETGWASRTLSEVEEQLERTWQPGVAKMQGLLLGIAIIGIFLFASNFVGLNSEMRSFDRHMWLADADLDRVEKIVADDRIMSDAEMREIVGMQLRNLLKEDRPKRMPTNERNRKLFLFGVPLIVVLGCIVVLLFSYPPYIYLWGDEVQRHDSRLNRRKAVWGILIGVLVVGVASRFFAEGLSQWIPKG